MTSRSRCDVSVEPEHPGANDNLVRAVYRPRKYLGSQVRSMAHYLMALSHLRPGTNTNNRSVVVSRLRQVHI